MSAERRYDIDEETGCWVWNGSIAPNGYGQIRIAGRSDHAHRISYQLHNRAPLSPFQQVHHVCDNRRCINPDHLMAVTGAENVQAGSLAKLTADLVRQIRAEDPAVRNRDLAPKYGVSADTISRVRLRKTWRSVR